MPTAERTDLHPKTKMVVVDEEQFRKRPHNAGLRPSLSCPSHWQPGQYREILSADTRPLTRGGAPGKAVRPLRCRGSRTGQAAI